MVGDPVDLDSPVESPGDRETTIWGDPVYEAGTTYLLFLSKIDHAPGWQPMMLAYGQFYLRTINGVDFFFPSRESAEIHAFPRPDGIVPETMKVMLAKDLIQHLRQVVTGKIPWQEKLILPEGEVKDVEVDMRSPPGHCVYFNIAEIILDILIFLNFHLLFLVKMMVISDLHQIPWLIPTCKMQFQPCKHNIKELI
ncbi:MAG: hypothetical protein IPJ06_11480 [Saprospiraceae bacterium]|nr:hypothetical protein [Saprospiraceae bacterium]